MKEKEKDVEIIRQTFLRLTENFLNRGNSIECLKSATISRDCYLRFPKRRFWSLNVSSIVVISMAIFFPTIVEYTSIVDIPKYLYGTRCIVPNNYFVWEFTRPVSDCVYCRDVETALILPNLTRKDFETYAYSSRPIIAKNAASHWPASKIFNLRYFRNLYDGIEGSYESIDEECQFLHFKSDFTKLRDVFEMNKNRALNRDGEISWYVGWKNCHSKVLESMNKFYKPPHFLPVDAEIPQTNYIFLGYDQGAIMHLDYIPRLMWQGQILGSKTWTVAPTPECENSCKRFNFSVATGDIVLINTRLWYHGTYVENGSFSLTVTSEYG